MIRTIRHLAAFLAALLALALAPSGAQAAETAEAYIQTRQNDVTALLKQRPGSVRDRKIAAVLKEMIDFGDLSMRTLGDHWGELSEDQQKDFTDVLGQLVTRNYERNIKSILDYDVAYLGQDKSDDGQVIVHTRASSRVKTHEEPIVIDYRMASAGDSWRVVDIVTEGSSLVGNYKRDFHRIITKDGYDALLRKMKAKLAKGQNV